MLFMLQSRCLYVGKNVSKLFRHLGGTLRASLKLDKSLERIEHSLYRFCVEFCVLLHHYRG